jgi:lipoprotein-releasing system permease protein
MSLLKFLLFSLVLLVVAIPVIFATILVVAVLVIPLGVISFLLVLHEILLQNAKYKAFMAARYLRSRRVNIISSAAISVGVMALIVVYSIMSGFQENLRSAIRGTYAHVMAQSRFRYGPDPALFIDAVTKLDHVVSVAPRISGVGMLAFSRRGLPDDVSRRGIQIMGVSSEAEEGSRDFRRTLERVPEDSGLRVSDLDHPFTVPEHLAPAGRSPRPGLLVGQRLFERLGILPGDTVKVFSAVLDEGEEPKARDRRFQLAGAYRSEMYDFELNTIFIPLEEAREFFRQGNEATKSELYITLDDYRNADSVRQDLESRYHDWYVETWQDRQANFLRAVETEKRIMMVILCFIVIIAAGLILATLTLMVMEKIRDIGILKALGGTTQGIMSIFLMNGLLIGVLGAVLGLVLGYIVSENINPIHDGLAAVIGFRVFNPDVYVFDEIPIRYEWWTIASFLAGTVLASLAASLWPSFKAARMNPVEALRYE